jgi:nucleotide-binding universal stress UspA family protein
MHTPAVVVGTDGTEPGTAAVRWAADEATRRRLPLKVVHVLDWDWSVSSYDYQGDCFAGLRRFAEATVRESARRARQVAPTVAVESLVPIGRPVSALVHLSRSAALMVIGSRTRDALAGTRLGSVSRRVAAHAECPVAVVHGRNGDLRDPVAVGVDDSAGTEAALEAAFNGAHQRGAGLVAVRSYRTRRIPGLPVGAAEQDDVERDRLSSRLAPWRARFPDVAVDTLVSTDSAAAVLVEVSHGTQLVVVGSHAHALFTATALGSTGGQVLHRACCPVLVAREPRTRKDDHESTYR